MNLHHSLAFFLTIALATGFNTYTIGETIEVQLSPNIPVIYQLNFSQKQPAIVVIEISDGCILSDIQVVYQNYLPSSRDSRFVIPVVDGENNFLTINSSNSINCNGILSSNYSDVSPEGSSSLAPGFSNFYFAPLAQNNASIINLVTFDNCKFSAFMKYGEFPTTSYYDDSLSTNGAGSYDFLVYPYYGFTSYILVQSDSTNLDTCQYFLTFTQVQMNNTVIFSDGETTSLQPTDESSTIVVIHEVPETHPVDFQIGASVALKSITLRTSNYSVQPITYETTLGTFIVSLGTPHPRTIYLEIESTASNTQMNFQTRLNTPTQLSSSSKQVTGSVTFHEINYFVQSFTNMGTLVLNTQNDCMSIRITSNGDYPDDLNGEGIVDPQTDSMLGGLDFELFSSNANPTFFFAIVGTNDHGCDYSVEIFFEPLIIVTDNQKYDVQPYQQAYFIYAFTMDEPKKFILLELGGEGTIYWSTTTFPNSDTYQNGCFSSYDNCVIDPRIPMNTNVTIYMTVPVTGLAPFSFHLNSTVPPVITTGEYNIEAGSFFVFTFEDSNLNVLTIYQEGVDELPRLYYAVNGIAYLRSSYSPNGQFMLPSNSTWDDFTFGTLTFVEEPLLISYNGGYPIQFGVTTTTISYPVNILQVTLPPSPLMFHLQIVPIQCEYGGNQRIYLGWGKLPGASSAQLYLNSDGKYVYSVPNSETSSSFFFAVETLGGQCQYSVDTSDNFTSTIQATLDKKETTAPVTDQIISFWNFYRVETSSVEIQKAFILEISIESDDEDLEIYLGENEFPSRSINAVGSMQKGKQKTISMEVHMDKNYYYLGVYAGTAGTSAVQYQVTAILKKTLPTGAIAGVIIGLVILIVGGTIGVFVFRRRRSSPQMKGYQQVALSTEDD